MSYKIDELNAEIAVSNEEAIWQKVKKESEELISQSNDNQIIQKAILKLAKAKIKEEMDKCTSHS